MSFPSSVKMLAVRYLTSSSSVLDQDPARGLDDLLDGRGAQPVPPGRRDRSRLDGRSRSGHL
jgi:hypothetical protein